MELSREELNDLLKVWKWVTELKLDDLTECAYKFLSDVELLIPPPPKYNVGENKKTGRPAIKKEKDKTLLERLRNDLKQFKGAAEDRVKL